MSTSPPATSPRQQVTRATLSGKRALHRRIRTYETKLAPKFAVIAYHRVARPRFDPWQIALPPEGFDAQLCRLAEAGRFVDLAGELARPWRWRLTDRSRRFALTFDDGYADNLHQALPILERHDAPATIFVASGYLDTPHFWWDRLAADLLGSSRPDDEVAAAVDRITGPVDGASTARLAVLDRAWNHMANREPDEILQLLEDLEGDLGPTPLDEGRPLTSDELVELAAHPLVTIGVHSVRHRRLSALSGADVRAELVECRHDLDRRLGVSDRILAYPYGAQDDRTAGIAKTAGFRHAFSVEPRWVLPTDKPLRLPRFNPRSDEQVGKLLAAS